jgi:hypothetical protein
MLESCWLTIVGVEIYGQDNRKIQVVKIDNNTFVLFVLWWPAMQSSRWTNVRLLRRMEQQVITFHPSTSAPIRIAEREIEIDHFRLQRIPPLANNNSLVSPFQENQTVLVRVMVPVDFRLYKPLSHAH